MKSFILAGLVVLIGAFLTMIAVQLIRVERRLIDICNIIEVKVRALYKKEA
ncbi:MAG: hypothetical protein PHC61_04530 [Chitinivibrionales bacterium]|nr:hypothetical protein [Chitinivibrionales bacterium]